MPDLTHAEALAALDRLAALVEVLTEHAPRAGWEGAVVCCQCWDHYYDVPAPFPCDPVRPWLRLLGQIGGDS